MFAKPATGRWWLPALLVLAAALRFAAFDLMEFKYDEVAVLQLARGWVECGEVPRFGMMSGVGVRNAPGFMFFLWPFAALHAPPLVVAGAIAALNVLAVWLAWRAGAAVAGPAAGRWAAAFLAVHPWLVLYARKIWAQSLLPPLALLALWILLRCERQPRSRAVFALPPLLALAVQIHFSAVCLAAGAAMWFACLAARRRLHGFLALTGVLAGLFLLVPYAGHLVATGWADAPWAAPGAPLPPGWIPVLDPLKMWARTAFAGGFGYPLAWGPVSLAAVLPSPAGGALECAAVAATALVLAAAAYAPRRPAAGGPRRTAPGWLLLFALLPPVFCAVQRGLPAPPHYFIVGVPALLVLAGAGAARAAEQRRAGGLAAAVVGVGAAVWLAVLAAVGLAGGSGGDYGPAYRAQKAVAGRLAAAGVGPDRLDARFTRDDSIGIRYLLGAMRPPASAHTDRSAILIDALLYPTQRPPPNAQRIGPYWLAPR